jgi:predicted restriction endonuclease
MKQNKKWLDEIIEVFTELGGVASYIDIYNKVLERGNMNLAPNWDSSIRYTIQSHSSDSETYTGKFDYFYSVEGKGKGIWGLRSLIEQTPKAYDSLENNPLSSEEIERVQLITYRYLRDTKIARELKAIYKNACQICKMKIQLSNNKLYSEAHHIQPLGQGHNGPDIKENLLVLCPNHHVEFDYGIICVDPDALTIKHINSTNTFNGEKLHCIHRIDKQYLQYHFDNIFNK